MKFTMPTAMLLAACTASPVLAAQENETPAAEWDDAERPDPAEQMLPAKLDADGPKIVAGLNGFAGDMHRNMQELQAGDFAISPISISTALGMAYAGAKGETAAELARVLRYPDNVTDFHKSNGLLLGGTQIDAKGRIVAVNNALWVQNGYRFQSDYFRAVTGHYNAGIKFVDYSTDKEAARARINRWVESKTNNRIKDFLDPSHVDTFTRNILVNTIYFKADWANVFDKAMTKESSFRMDSGGKTRLPLMNQRENFAYTERDNVQLLALPYRGGEMDMVVLLPGPGKLNSLERQIATEGFDPWLTTIDQAIGQDTILTLPKFKIESKYELKDVLAVMGLKTTFSNDANFTGMTEPTEVPLKIGQVIHQVFVEVEEKGTEAAAATAVVMVMVTSARRGPPPKPKIFRADHPFLFLIRDRRTGAILFTGRFTGRK